MILGFEYLEGGVEVRVQQLKGYAYVLAKYKPVNHVNTYDVVRMVLEGYYILGGLVYSCIGLSYLPCASAPGS